VVLKAARKSERSVKSPKTRPPGRSMARRRTWKKAELRRWPRSEQFLDLTTTRSHRRLGAARCNRQVVGVVRSGRRWPDSRSEAASRDSS